MDLFVLTRVIDRVKVLLVVGEWPSVDRFFVFDILVSVSNYFKLIYLLGLSFIIVTCGVAHIG